MEYCEIYNCYCEYAGHCHWGGPTLECPYKED